MEKKLDSIKETVVGIWILLLIVGVFLVLGASRIENAIYVNTCVDIATQGKYVSQEDLDTCGYKER